MDKILNFLGTLVLSIGGIGGILIALSSFIAKLWADLFMRKKTAEYDKQIESYKNELELTRDRYKALNEQILYKNQRVFDVEFKIYQDIIPLIINLSSSVTDYFLKKDMLKEHIEFYNIISIINQVRAEITKHLAFMDDNICNIINKYIFDCIDYVKSVNSFRENILKQNNIEDNTLYINALNENENYANLVLSYMYYLSSKEREISEAIKNYIRENGKIK